MKKTELIVVSIIICIFLLGLINPFSAKIYLTNNETSNASNISSNFELSGETNRDTEESNAQNPEGVNLTDSDIVFSTFLGGSNQDTIQKTVIDKHGNIVVAGFTNSNDFPVQNAYQSSFKGGTDGFLVKVSPEGNLLFSTYFGGTGDDQIVSLALDTNDNIYISGTTFSTDFPTLNAYQSTYKGNTDGFLAKFSSEGQLQFSTYLGGIENEYVNEMIIDIDGNIILAGTTQSNDYPTLNAFNGTYGGNTDIFLTKFSQNGSVLFSTFVGGGQNDFSYDLKVDSNKYILLVGSTRSYDFPVYNGYNVTYGGNTDGFLIKLSSSGELVYSTFLGGSEDDFISKITLDSNSDIILGGTTSSLDFPNKNAINDSLGGWNDLFLTKFSSSGELVFSTYFGGLQEEELSFITLDTNNNIIMGGYTSSPDYVLVEPIFAQYRPAPEDSYMVFLTKFTTDGGTIIFSTYIDDLVHNTQAVRGNEIYFSGVNFGEGLLKLLVYSTSENKLVTNITIIEHSFISSINIEKSNQILLTGSTYGYPFSFPLKNAFQPNFGGNENCSFWIYCEGYILKFRIPVIDIDSDGMFDSWEEEYGLDTSIDDALEDFDNDGMTNIYEYLNGLVPNYNDALEDKDQDGLTNILEFTLGSSAERKDTDGDGIPDGYEYLMGLNILLDDANEDTDGDGLPNSIEYQYGLKANDSTDGLGDLDGDGMSNVWEYQNGLLLLVNDAQADKDQDGMPNLWEYQMDLNPNSNDAQEDKEPDGMPNLWEYQMGLNATKNDANEDKDGDWVTNYHEYLSGTDANNFWSFPLLYSQFPYIINAPIGLMLGFTALGLVTGATGAYQLKKQKQIRLMRRLGAPDYPTALQVQQGKFSDYETYQKALAQHITDREEYEFMKELNGEKRE